MISRTLEKDLASSGVRFFYGSPYKKRLGPHAILCGGDDERTFTYRTVINAAGLYADRIARDFGYSADTTILPFKGIYLEYYSLVPEDRPVKTNITPVPNLGQPFLGGTLHHQGRWHDQDRPHGHSRLLERERQRSFQILAI